MSLLSSVTFRWLHNSTRPYLYPIEGAYKVRVISLIRSYAKDRFPVGPAPTQDLTLEDTGYTYFQKNVEFFRKHGRLTYLTNEQLKEFYKRQEIDLTQKLIREYSLN